MKRPDFGTRSCTHTGTASYEELHIERIPFQRALLMDDTCTQLTRKYCIVLQTDFNGQAMLAANNNDILHTLQTKRELNRQRV